MLSLHAPHVTGGTKNLTSSLSPKTTHAGQNITQKTSSPYFTNIAHSKSEMSTPAGPQKTVNKTHNTGHSHPPSGGAGSIPVRGTLAKPPRGGFGPDRAPRGAGGKGRKKATAGGKGKGKGKVPPAGHQRKIPPAPRTCGVVGDASSPLVINDKLGFHAEQLEACPNKEACSGTCHLHLVKEVVNLDAAARRVLENKAREARAQAQANGVPVPPKPPRVDVFRWRLCGTLVNCPRMASHAHCPDGECSHVAARMEQYYRDYPSSDEGEDYEEYTEPDFEAKIHEGSVAEDATPEETQTSNCPDEQSQATTTLRDDRPNSAHLLTTARLREELAQLKIAKEEKAAVYESKEKAVTERPKDQTEQKTRLASLGRLIASDEIAGLESKISQNERLTSLSNLKESDAVEKAASREAQSERLASLSAHKVHGWLKERTPLEIQLLQKETKVDPEEEASQEKKDITSLVKKMSLADCRFEQLSSEALRSEPGYSGPNQLSHFEDSVRRRTHHLEVNLIKEKEHAEKKKSRIEARTLLDDLYRENSRWLNGEYDLSTRENYIDMLDADEPQNVPDDLVGGAFPILKVGNKRITTLEMYQKFDLKNGTELFPGHDVRDVGKRTIYLAGEAERAHGLLNSIVDSTLAGLERMGIMREQITTEVNRDDTFTMEEYSQSRVNKRRSYFCCCSGRDVKLHASRGITRNYLMSKFELCETADIYLWMFDLLRSHPAMNTRQPTNADGNLYVSMLGAAKNVLQSEEYIGVTLVWLRNPRIYTNTLMHYLNQMDLTGNRENTVVLPLNRKSTQPTTATKAEKPSKVGLSGKGKL